MCLRRRKFKGLRIFGNSLLITHYQFVDNVCLIGNSSLKEEKYIQALLSGLMEASYMVINKDNIIIFFFNCRDSFH